MPRRLSKQVGELEGPPKSDKQKAVSFRVSAYSNVKKKGERKETIQTLSVEAQTGFPGRLARATSSLTDRTCACTLGCYSKTYSVPTPTVFPGRKKKKRPKGLDLGRITREIYKVGR